MAPRFPLLFCPAMVFWTAVLLASCLAMGFSAPSGSASVLASAVGAIGELFSVECVYFLSETSRIGLGEESLAKAFSVSLETSFGFSNLSRYSVMLGRDDQRQCHSALRVMNLAKKAKDLKGFKDFYKNLAGKARSGAWLLFTESFQDEVVSQLLQNVHLSIDTKVIVAWIHDDTVHLKEIYQVGPAYPLRQQYFGNWSLSRGLVSNRYGRNPGTTDLEGLRLNVAYIEGNVPFTEIRSLAKSPALEGFFGEIWNALETRLNISSNLVKVELNREGGDKNSWLIIMNLLKARKIDVGLGDFNPSKMRINEFDFTHPLLTSDFQVFYRHIQAGRHSKIFTLLFGTDICSTLIIWALINSISISCTTFLRRRFLRRRGELITLQTSFFMTFSGLCAQGSPSIPRFSSCRTLFLFTYLVAAVVIPSFSACLTRHFTSTPTGKTFRNLADIYEEGFHRFIVVDGSYEYFIFKLNEGKNIWGRIFKEHLEDKKLPKSYEEALLMTCTHQDVAFFTVASTLLWELDKSKNKDIREKCLLNKMTLNAGKSANAIILPKFSRFRELFNYHLKLLHSTGVISRLERKYWPNHLAHPRKNWESLGLWHSLALFYIVFYGGLLSLLLIVLEMITAKTLPANSPADTHVDPLLPPAKAPAQTFTGGNVQAVRRDRLFCKNKK